MGGHSLEGQEVHSTVKKVKQFKQVYVEITNRCNMACSFCPRTGRPPADMEPALFARIMEELKPLTDKVYLHVMGEPLMHPEFPHLIDTCASLRMPVAITTNGSLLHTDSAMSLLDPVVQRVNISLDALFQNSMHLLDEGMFERIVSFTRQAFDKRPDLYIHYRLWNLGDFSEGLESDSNSRICRLIEEAFGITISSQGHSSGRKSRCLLNRLYLHVDTLFSWPGAGPPNTSGFCHALSSQFAILADGTVVPCCLDHEGVTALGNCRDTSLTSILDSPRAEAMLKGFHERRLVEPLCQRCTFISRFDSRYIKSRSKNDNSLITVAPETL